MPFAWAFCVFLLGLRVRVSGSAFRGLTGQTSGPVRSGQTFETGKGKAVQTEWRFAVWLGFL